jgi:hypothetical protein
MPCGHLWRNTWLGRGFLLQTFETDTDEDKNPDSDIKTMRQLLDEDDAQEEERSC